MTRVKLSIPSVNYLYRDGHYVRSYLWMDGFKPLEHEL